MENNINDIDKFFRENLGGQEGNYVPGAWESMETMLNQGDKGFMVKNVRNYLLASFVGAIMLGGSLVAYISGTETPGVTINEKPAKIAATQEPTLALPNTSTPSVSAETKDSELSKEPTTTDVSGIPDKPSIQTKPIVSAPAIVIPVLDKNETEETEELTTAKEETGVYEKNHYTFDDLVAGKSIALGYIQLPSDITDSKGMMDSVQTMNKKVNAMRSYYRFKLGITAGANFNSVLNNTSNSKQFGSGLMAGIYYSKNFSSRWGILAEVAYLRRTGHNLTRNINQTRYFFEKTTTDYFLVTKTTDHIQLPVMARYNLTSRHSFALGLIASYMIDSRTEISTRNEQPGEKSSVTETKKGVYEDMNPFGYGFTAGYEFKLPGLYSIGLRYNQQLNDITKNSFFNDGKQHLPTDVQLYIKLNLIK